MYIHDVLPLNYNEQGIHPNDPSISKYTKFFSKNDSLLEARKKWYDFILQDYVLGCLFKQDHLLNFN